MPSRRAWMVMGTLLEVTVYRPAGQDTAASEDLRAAYEAVVGVDRRMSLYRDDSELSALNEAAGSGPVAASQPLLEVLEAARHYGSLSRGAFDVTVEPLVQVWGLYFFERDELPSAAQIEAARHRVGHDRIRLDPEAGAVGLEEGTHVDLGAIAKGYAVDLALARLAERGVPAALIDLGGNIGVLGTPPGEPSWEIGVRHPRDADSLLGSLRLDPGRSVATTGDYERFIEIDGERYAHVIDPRSGWPVRGVFAVTVVAPDATAADALSTAAYVLGPDDGMALLAACDGVEGLAVTPASGEVAGRLRVEVTAGLHGSPPPFTLVGGVDAEVVAWRGDVTGWPSDC